MCLPGQSSPTFVAEPQPADLTEVNAHVSPHCVISLKTHFCSEAEFNILFGKVVDVPAGQAFRGQGLRMCKRVLRQVCLRETDPPPDPSKGASSES